MKILNIVGARPNFMKVAPLHRAFSSLEGVVSRIIHTGQHYDAKMSDVFFNQLELPKPDHYLGIGGGTHTQQTARIMLQFEEVLNQEKPDLVLVVGDVNSTIACALVAAKMGIPVAHVEAGLRSGDRTMPEEINRILTDSISDYLFVTEHSGLVNLAKEGVADEKVHFVGNVMIDSLIYYREKARMLQNLDTLGLSKGDYVLMTMHRPSNVDQTEGLQSISRIIESIVPYKKVVFPIHPRTAKNAAELGLLETWKTMPGLQLLEPQGYLEFLNLMQHAFLLVTDSGGIQEETTYLQVPCFTFRSSTERPVTVTMGTNRLFSDLDPRSIFTHFQKLLSGEEPEGAIPPFWDGRAAVRIAAILTRRQ
ncbi:MAG: UDP-N-acetylglucosamine 2-epimerase (non-hydrolyzing) [Saprospirales bacterium]|nr:UDP-N-acetylglucosamine 2-epimerase (non-hydrolyzing) [Saprospirales bacterium]